jgi:phytoene dehydrogenase-like protein
MSAPSIIVIGAGIGGLAAACYAQMNGYRVRILEMHTGPGGVCTAWTIGGYTFDGCIHNLAGTSEDSVFHRMWRELGVVPARPMFAYPELVSVERLDGASFTVCTDLDRLEEHMKSLFPEDARRIGELIRAARSFVDFDLLGLAAAGASVRARALAALPRLLRWGRITLEQYAAGFRNRFLRSAFPTLVYDWPGQTMVMLLAFLGRMHKGDFGWPRGGSLAFARAIEDRFRSLGGEISYGTRVESILVERDRAVGVRIAGGAELRADRIVSNGYGSATIFELLGGRYVNRAIRDYYAHPVDRIDMGIHVSLGVARDLSGEPHAIVLPLAEPVTLAGERRDRLYVEPFGFDASLAPAGRSPLKVVFATSFRYWEELGRDPARYAAEKQHIAETVVRLLEARFPGLASEVEVMDVATPLTTQRYTGNGRGFEPSTSRMALALFTGRRLSQTLPGLDRFHMVGQWAGVPGVPLVAAMGRDVSRDICRRDGRPFRTELA